MSREKYRLGGGRNWFPKEYRLFAGKVVSCKIKKVPRDIQCEVTKEHGKFGKTGLNNWSINKSNKGGRDKAVIKIWK